ncbi:MAG: thioesterase family protein [Sedimentibacter sp.]
MITNKIHVGLSTTYEKVITPADSYITKSVQIESLMSTPALLATVIEISWNMLKKFIPSDYLTVVTNFQSNHLHPTMVGEKVIFKMTIEDIDNNRVSMSFSGYDCKGEFCNGILEKAIVKSEKLLEDAFSRVNVHKDWLTYKMDA